MNVLSFVHYCISRAENVFWLSYVFDNYLENKEFCYVLKIYEPPKLIGQHTNTKGDAIRKNVLWEGSSTM